ncbi:MAG: hypothetical protein H0T70_00880, partial [Acidimicrobiia bacterium]|nr:hypothetical protein [Acidimicrobiia bacterium]
LAANLTELGESLTTEQRLVSTIAVGISWVVLAAVDILARAYVTAHVPAPSPAAEAAPTEDRRANRSAEVPAVATNGSTSTRRPSGAECAEVAIIVTGERLVRGATT